MTKKKITYKSTIDTPEMHVLLSDVSIIDAASDSARLQIMRKIPNIKVVQVIENKVMSDKELTKAEEDILTNFYLDLQAECHVSERMNDLAKKRVHLIMGGSDPLYKTVIDKATTSSFTKKDIEALSGSEVNEAMEHIFLLFKGNS